MKLFSALFRKNMARGHLWRGKDRMIRLVTIKDTQNLRNEFEMEEENMFYLRHSYLTPEQSHGHAKALGKNELNYINKVLGRKKEFKPNRTTESILAHLRYSEAWE